MTKLIIVPPGKNADHTGEGVYALVAETGECLATHFCSNIDYAAGDLALRRTERHKRWDEKFPNGWQVVHLADSGFTLDDLITRSERIRRAA